MKTDDIIEQLPYVGWHDSHLGADPRLHALQECKSLHDFGEGAAVTLVAPIPIVRSLESIDAQKYVYFVLRKVADHSFIEQHAIAGYVKIDCLPNASRLFLCILRDTADRVEIQRRLPTEMCYPQWLFAVRVFKKKVDCRTGDIHRHSPVAEHIFLKTITAGEVAALRVDELEMRQRWK